MRVVALAFGSLAPLALCARGRVVDRSPIVPVYSNVTQ